MHADTHTSPRYLLHFLPVTEYNTDYRDLPDGPGVKTLGYQCKGHGFSPGWGTKITKAVSCSQKHVRKIIKKTDYRISASQYHTVLLDEKIGKEGLIRTKGETIFISLKP